MSIWLFLPVGAVQSTALRQSNFPAEGWQVCADLGFGDVPGVGNVQQVLLCTADGWEVQAYCVDPNLPVPEVNTMCSFTQENLFWCGFDVQQFAVLQIQATPGPTETPTPTATATSTFTFTPTSTATVTATFTPTFTATFTATGTLTPVPPTATPVVPPAQITTPTPTSPSITDTPVVITVGPPRPGPTPTATVYRRPPPGGPTNLVPALSLLGVTAGLGLLAAAWLTGRRR